MLLAMVSAGILKRKNVMTSDSYGVCGNLLQLSFMFMNKSRN